VSRALGGGCKNKALGRKRTERADYDQPVGLPEKKLGKITGFGVEKPVCRRPWDWTSQLYRGCPFQAKIPVRKTNMHKIRVGEGDYTT